MARTCRKNRLDLAIVTQIASMVPAGSLGHLTNEDAGNAERTHHLERISAPSAPSVADSKLSEIWEKGG